MERANYIIRRDTAPRYTVKIDGLVTEAEAREKALNFIARLGEEKTTACTFVLMVKNAPYHYIPVATYNC